jgi:beta-lactamase regulating signal transducer with metallopeptidase domain
MTPLAQALNTALLHFIWQGLAIGLLLWIALFLLRRRSASVRYVANCAALVLLVLAPLATAWTAYMPPSAGHVLWKSISTIAETPSFARPDAAPVGISSGFQGLETWILPAWALGVSFFALRLMWCWGHTSALRRTGTPADSTFLEMVLRAAERTGVTRRIRVLMSSVAEVPSVIGWMRPVLLLPVTVATGLTPEQLEALIAHELAHVRRHDYLVNLAQTVIETVLFYHPAVWWVSSKIRYERELCCDDLAVAAVGDAASYARALARLEEIRVFRPNLAMGAAGGPLFHRIERLLGGDVRQQGPSRLACAIGLLVGVACLALNMGWAETRQAAQGNTIRVEDFLPPVPPGPPMPPSSRIAGIAPVPPMPPPLPMTTMPPAPPLPSAPPLPPLLAQRADVPWILFRGDRVMSNGSAADETEARAARQASGGGDALWFRLEGKAYITQDKATLDRTDSGRLRDSLRALEIAEQNRRTRRENELRQSLMLAELQANLAALKARVPGAINSVDDLTGVRLEVQKLRQHLAELEAGLHQQELAVLQEKIAEESERKYGAAERLFMPDQIPELLLEAVVSGKARPVQ